MTLIVLFVWVLSMIIGGYLGAQRLIKKWVTFLVTFLFGPFGLLLILTSNKKVRTTLALLLAVILPLSAQDIVSYNTVIHEKCYNSYYSTSIKAPSFVIYKLYHGGGNISRQNMTFKSILPHFDYSRSGYDIGHMCNAEDFAYNKQLEESTFRYYNSVPQTPHLNRGTWKTLEYHIRQQSQTDSLLIICGGEDYYQLIPTKCFKIVYSLTTHQLLEADEFDNDNIATYNSFTPTKSYEQWYNFSAKLKAQH